MKLERKVAIITGASRGIGLACAKVFGKYGCSVTIASNNEEEGKTAACELESLGVSVHFLCCDVRDEQDIRLLVDQTVARFGRLDCMVNNAGWHPPAMTIDQISVEDFESLLKLNLTSSFMGCKFTAAELRKTRGSIVNISSEVALIGQAAAVSYVASKAGQIGLTKALALDLAPEGVRVNAVCAAGVMTPLMQEWADTQYDPQGALAVVDSWHPMGRMATAEEIGEVCAFLASAEASFVTGQVICPDGGAMLGYRR